MRASASSSQIPSMAVSTIWRYFSSLWRRAAVARLRSVRSRLMPTQQRTRPSSSRTGMPRVRMERYTPSLPPMRNSSSHGWPLCNRRGRPSTMRSRSSGCTHRIGPGKFLQRLPKHFQETAADVDHLSLRVPHPDSERNQLADGAVARFRFGEGPQSLDQASFLGTQLPHQVLALLFRAFPFGHVAHDLGEASNFATLAAQGSHHARGPEPAAVLADVPVVILASARLQGPLHFLLEHAVRNILRGEELLRGAADDLLFWITQQPLRPALQVCTRAAASTTKIA